MKAEAMDEWMSMVQCVRVNVNMCLYCEYVNMLLVVASMVASMVGERGECCARSLNSRLNE